MRRNWQRRYIRTKSHCLNVRVLSTAVFAVRPNALAFAVVRKTVLFPMGSVAGRLARPQMRGIAGFAVGFARIAVRQLRYYTLADG
jgi:hypothetical protein